MIVLVKIDESNYAKINSLVKAGKFPSMESFLDLAIRNQIVLEIEGGLPHNEKCVVQQSEKTGGEKLPIPSKKPKTIEAPAINESIKQTPLWGQINRISPAKFVLRILLNSLASTDEDTVDLKKFSAEVAEKATEFRMFAKKKDKKTRIRGEFLYVGFPKKDPMSQQRFLNYYVGKSPVQKWTDSVLVGLSLANIKETDTGSRVIGLTSQGLEFSELFSPLIDDFFAKTKQISAPLSKEEVNFLINHMKIFRPGELKFMKFTVEAIRKGASTPTKLLASTIDFLKAENLGIQLSEKVANTMQVGVVGRLIEFGIIKIEKSAQKSTYKVPEEAEELIGKL